ncbi:SMI1/KNR4 family protein [Lysinibacillus sp. RC79]|uniref:SMI1/KNR4 family protein n=1 Tax=Lysinibacillus sp. RC79 TaxID=3156296 RepID=UPI0035130105
MDSIITKSIDALKSRLDPENILVVQRDEGYLYNVKFEFNNPATIKDVGRFVKKTGFFLPVDYKEFLLKHNGALLFSDVEYGGGFELLSIEEVHKEYLEYLDYFPKNWYPISVDNGDYIIIDSSQVEKGHQTYLIRYQGGEPVEYAIKLNMNFTTWLDRLIVSQGSEFWLW